ncbi:hypothetical protein DEU56DRAFT_773219 [Suillus clintonianus]|uniref:uncharacterized protein n=1 Tax=Suillus clintonianus TaxID=1904413 RepID=UPI001B877BDA|nr:uncharacterized protein DEU56DRAFT_773219 [Suillus clintonianus]KAG2154114.1 hypothetical protein DEU56DRAFT_773219 [Suillus clintonianus]
MNIEQNELNDEHPLVLELSSLRQTAARFQHEAHQAALKLQRYTLAAAQTNARLHLLESQHSLLASELATLRAHSLPPPNSQSDIHVVQELTLALRRSSEKLDLTEHALAERAAELVNILNEAHRARHDAEGAYKLAASARAREEEGKVRERGLATRLQAAEEERRLIELVVHEYADLVRSLDGRKSSLGNGSAVLQNASASASSLTLVEGLHEGKTNLHRLMTEFAFENEKSETTITQLRNDIATLESILDAERKTAAQDRAQLAKAQLDLEILKLDDTTAAKMVSRYMKFSQSQTNALQSTLTTLQTRHTSTQHTLQSTINDTEARMHAHMTENARLRDALEELGEEVTREAYGRRREVALRLALLAREEALGEALRRWVRRAQEGIHRCTDADSQMYATLERVVKDAESLLMALDAEVVLEDGSKVPGVLGRLVLAKDAVMRMSEEIGVEVGRRVAAERRLSLGMGSLDETAHEQTVSVEGTPVDVTERPTHTKDANTDIPHTQDEIPACSQVPTSPPSLPAGGNKDTEGTPSPIIRDITPGTSQLLRELPIELSQSPAVSILDLTQTPAGEAACILPPSAEPCTPLASANELTMEHDTEGISDTQETRSLVQTPTPPPSLPAEVQRDTEGAPSTVIPNIMSGTSQMLFDLPIGPTGEAVCTLPSSAELRTPLASANQLTIEHDADEISDTKDTTSPLPLTTPAKQKENPTNQFLERNEDSGIFFSPAAATPEIKANEPNNLIATTIPLSQPPSIPNELSSLLSSLNKVNCRYDALQYAFRDCSLALKDLKRVLPPVTITSSSPPIPTPSPQSLLRTALDRISDYTEDARVELEIRITDEALAIRGFETLLTVPGALCLSSDLDSNLEEMRAFVEGTDEGVRRAKERLEGKLGDVQHDVAVVKRAVHELQVQVDEEVEEKKEGDKDTEHKSWSAWTSSLLPRSSTPTPTQTPTFGSVMTSPRLNRAPSEKQLFSLGELELKIPMPLPASVSPPQPGYGGLGLGAGVTPGLGRQRTMSMMYSLGIGSRASTSVSSLVMPGMSPVKSGGSRGRFVTTPLAGQTHGDRDESDVE